ncbi:MAG: FAD-dependent oxidoreductase [Candidatus Obscuribacterales bacterium]|nr:FAD-dependent oxidoreductase [Candidatus Obscuribacterales bacterium]
MNIQEIKNRRQFLKELLALSALGVFGLNHRVAGEEQALTVEHYRGDDPDKGHALRDGNLPDLSKLSKSSKLETSDSADFVIVGGGITGLLTAYKLRNYKTVLLEAGNPGGQSSLEERKGLPYSLGAAYFCDLELVDPLLQELGLKPTCSGIRPMDLILDDGQKLNLAETKAEKDGRFSKELSELSKLLKVHSETAVISVIDGIKPDQSKLDSIKLAEILTGFGQPFLKFIDRFLLSSICLPSSEISTLAGLYLLQDLFEAIYTFPGGNGAISKALAARLNEHITTNAFVWSVQVKGDGADVLYQVNDSIRKIACKHVIVAAPPIVAGRILQGISNAEKGPLYSFRYGSYLVSNFVYQKELKQFSNFENFNLSKTPLETSLVNDFIPAESVLRSAGNYNPSMGSILTVYSPFQPGSQGRSLLFGSDRVELLTQVAQELNSRTGLERSNIETVVPTRWGHAMAAPVTGYFRRLENLLNEGRKNPFYTLNHSSLFGVQCLENAYVAARYGADRALGRLK